MVIEWGKLRKTYSDILKVILIMLFPKTTRQIFQDGVDSSFELNMKRLKASLAEARKKFKEDRYGKEK